MLGTLILLLLGINFGPTLPVETASNCDAKLAAAGLCATNNGTSLSVEGKKTPPTNREHHRTDEGVLHPKPTGPSQEDKLEACSRTWDDPLRCYYERDDTALPDAEEPAAARPITVTDLAEFTPEGTSVVGEPGNAGVAGLPVNFVADAEQHTRTGVLFGRPIAVRFTPAGYDFRFGDGTRASTTNGGTEWASLGQAAFTPTGTSHAYATRGMYLAAVDVRYTAELDVGAGWFPVPGQLTARGPTQEIRIFEARTALVARTCAQTPSAPGC